MNPDSNPNAQKVPNRKQEHKRSAFSGVGLFAPGSAGRGVEASDGTGGGGEWAKRVFALAIFLWPPAGGCGVRRFTGMMAEGRGK